jgi:hypothetical protein
MFTQGIAVQVLFIKVPLVYTTCQAGYAMHMEFSMAAEILPISSDFDVHIALGKQSPRYLISIRAEMRIFIQSQDFNEVHLDTYRGRRISSHLPEINPPIKNFARAHVSPTSRS